MIGQGGVQNIIKWQIVVLYSQVTFQAQKNYLWNHYEICYRIYIIELLNFIVILDAVQI